MNSPQRPSSSPFFPAGWPSPRALCHIRATAPLHRALLMPSHAISCHLMPLHALPRPLQVGSGFANARRSLGDRSDRARRSLGDGSEMARRWLGRTQYRRPGVRRTWSPRGRAACAVQIQSHLSVAVTTHSPEAVPSRESRLHTLGARRLGRTSNERVVASSLRSLRQLRVARTSMTRSL